MMRRPPRSTRTDTLFPYTTLFRSQGGIDLRLADLDDVQVHVAGGQRLQRGAQLLDVGALLADHHAGTGRVDRDARLRSEEHTSELQSLMRISYAVFCLKTKT